MINEPNQERRQPDDVSSTEEVDDSADSDNSGYAEVDERSPANIYNTASSKGVEKIDGDNPFSIRDREQFDSEQFDDPVIPPEAILVVGALGTGLLAHRVTSYAVRVYQDRQARARETAPRGASVEPEMLTAVGERIVKPGECIAYSDSKHSYPDGTNSGQVGDMVTVGVDPESGKIILRATSNASRIHIKGRDGTIRQGPTSNGEEIQLKPGESFSINGAEFQTVSRQLKSRFGIGFIAGDPIRYNPIAAKDPILDPNRVGNDKPSAMEYDLARSRARKDNIASIKVGDVYELSWQYGAGPVLVDVNNAQYEFQSGSTFPRGVQIGCDENGIYIMPSQDAPVTPDKFGEPAYDIYVKKNGKGEFQKNPAGEGKYYIQPRDVLWAGEPNNGTSTELSLSYISDSNIPKAIKPGTQGPEPFRARALAIAGRREDNLIRNLPPGSEIHLAVNDRKTIDMNAGAMSDAAIMIDKNGDAFITVSKKPTSEGNERQVTINRQGQEVTVKASDGWVPIGINDSLVITGEKGTCKTLSLKQTFLPTQAVIVNGRGVGLDIVKNPNTQDRKVEIGRSTPDRYSASEIAREEFSGFSQLSERHAAIGYDSKGRLYIEDIGSNDGSGKVHSGTWIRSAQGELKALKQSQTYYPQAGDEVWLGVPDSKGSLQVEIASLLPQDNNSKSKNKTDAPAIEHEPAPATQEELAKLKPTDAIFEIDEQGKRSVRQIYFVESRGEGQKKLPLTQEEVQTLGEEGSRYESVAVRINGKDEVFYRPHGQDNRENFYRLKTDAAGQGELVRDYRIVLSPLPPLDGGESGQGAELSPKRPKEGPSQEGPKNDSRERSERPSETDNSNRSRNKRAPQGESAELKSPEVLSSVPSADASGIVEAETVRTVEIELHNAVTNNIAEIKTQLEQPNLSAAERAKLENQLALHEAFVHPENEGLRKEIGRRVAKSPERSGVRESLGRGKSIYILGAVILAGIAGMQQQASAAERPVIMPKFVRKPSKE